MCSRVCVCLECVCVLECGVHPHYVNTPRAVVDHEVCGGVWLVSETFVFSPFFFVFVSN